MVYDRHRRKSPDDRTRVPGSLGTPTADEKLDSYLTTANEKLTRLKSNEDLSPQVKKRLIEITTDNLRDYFTKPGSSSDRKVVDRSGRIVMQNGGVVTAADLKKQLEMYQK